MNKILVLILTGLFVFKLTAQSLPPDSVKGDAIVAEASSAGMHRLVKKELLTRQHGEIEHKKTVKIYRNGKLIKCRSVSKWRTKQTKHRFVHVYADSKIKRSYHLHLKYGFIPYSPRYFH